jgi:hypothetical protein
VCDVRALDRVAVQACLPSQAPSGCSRTPIRCPSTRHISSACYSAPSASEALRMPEVRANQKGVVAAVQQPPGRRMCPPSCMKCDGSGGVKKATN